MTRTLVVSDVHANAPALEAVLAAEPDPDAVLFLGDAVDCGPHPEAVCERLRGLDVAAGVEGNHDRAVLAADAADEGRAPPADGADADPDPHRRWQRWTNDRLTPASRAFLRSLDRTDTAVVGGRRLRLHHGDAAPPDGHDGPWPTRVTPGDDAPLFGALAARYDEDVVLLGHSHYPFDATVDGTRFVNPGSVGLQRPGWPPDRARYGVVEDGEFGLRSVAYDPHRVIADSRALGNPYLDDWARSDAVRGAGGDDAPVDA